MNSLNVLAFKHCYIGFSGKDVIVQCTVDGTNETWILPYNDICLKDKAYYSDKLVVSRTDVFPCIATSANFNIAIELRVIFSGTRTLMEQVR